MQIFITSSHGFSKISTAANIRLDYHAINGKANILCRNYSLALHRHDSNTYSNMDFYVDKKVNAGGHFL